MWGMLSYPIAERAMRSILSDQVWQAFMDTSVNHGENMTMPKYRIPQMCSYTILGLRPIENLKARKELVIRCTKPFEQSSFCEKAFTILLGVEVPGMHEFNCDDAMSENRMLGLIYTSKGTTVELF